MLLMLEKTLERPLDCRKIKPVNPKGNQSWIFIGGTDAEAETPILRPPDAKGRLIGKDPDTGKDLRHKKKGITKDEMVGWHHWLNGHEFEQALEIGDGQGGLACCNPWGHKKSDMTEQLNWTEWCPELNFRTLKCMMQLCCVMLGTRHISSSTQFPHLQRMELDKLACDVTARADVLGQHTPLGYRL